MNKLLLIVGISILFLSSHTKAQENSVLAEGDWYKIAVSESGVYKINRSFLANIGIDVANIDPRKIQIYGNPGGMLPQANDTPRPVGLTENAIRVIGEEDGSFDANDLIVFYADGPDDFNYDDGNLTFEKNIYSRKNYYFITIGSSNGRRVETSPNEGNGLPKITTFDDFQHHELSLTNFLISGREWYGEKFDLETQYTLDFEFSGIIAGTDIKVTSNVMAQSFATSTFNLSLNGTTLGTHTVSSVPDYRQPSGRYAVKGVESTDIFLIGSDQISNTDQLNLSYSYVKNSSGQSIGFLDEVLVEVKRNLSWSGSPMRFRSLESVDNPSSTFEISNSDSDLHIWNITDVSTPLNQDYTQQGNKSLFGTATNNLQEFIAFKNSSLNTPDFIEKVNNQNLHGMSTPDLLIVTHPDFKLEAQRLASFRSTNDELTAKVVTTPQIYNEFSGGKQDVTAIRDLAKHLYDNNSRLKYLLLFGRGSYDYLDIIDNNTNFVPIYESRNSLHPLETYGSDDYFGFLEDSEGEWVENSSGDHTLDIGVGRLPVTSLDEASDVVDKLINYSTNKKNFGAWRNTISFVADDGDGNLHQQQSDKLSQFVDTTYSSFNPNKLYLDAYTQVSRPGGEISPDASEALNKTIEKGSLVVNFTGHGGESGWMQEQVLDIAMIKEWENKNKLPLFVTATCEFSRHDDPRRISGGELVLTNPEGGGIGIVSTCRPVNSSSNFELNKAFYNTVFSLENNQHYRLGDIIRVTKNNENVNQIGNRNFALIGDPSLQLTYPEKQLAISSIETNGIVSDTINALSKVTITGEVINDASFSGTLFATVYDKESSFVTLGNENAPFNYYDKQNIIFKGQASITNGQFQFDFIVPKNISYQIDQGKISLYAVDNSKSTDAHGSKYVQVGGSNAQPNTDTTGPEISIYLGDSTNESYKDIASNTLLIARIQDESGINISGYGIGNSLKAILDDSVEFILNEFYEASLDTYQRGWVSFPLDGLQKGEHTITIKAWDTYNNSSQELISFVVLDPNKLSISKLFNYPNPFNETTQFGFQHNRAGEDLEIELDILSTTGSIVQKHQFYIEDSGANVNLGEWDGTNSEGEKLKSGLYIYKLKVRLKKDGAIQDKHQRLVLIK